MSKISIIVIFVVFNSVICHHISKDDPLTSQLMYPFKEIGDYVLNKTAYYCPDIEDQLKDELFGGVSQCAKEQIYAKKTFCPDVIDNFVDCFKPITKIFTDCFPEQSKELPSMLIDAASSAFTLVCKSSGAELLELLNPCVLSPHDSHPAVCLDLGHTWQEFSRPNNKIPSKTDLCKLFSQFGDCMKQSQKGVCAEDTKAVFNKFYDQSVNAILNKC